MIISRYPKLYTALQSLGLMLAVATAQAQEPWHGKERSIHYIPSGNDFLKVQGSYRFNRSLYGTNTGFRVEAGDLPEFALYMPGMGGNIRLAIAGANGQKWLTDADSIATIYKPGAMHYNVYDKMLGNAVLNLQVLALANGEGIIIRSEVKGSLDNFINLVTVFGGASGRKFSRDGDIGADPESVFYLKPENCTDNIFSIQDHTFLLDYAKNKEGKMSRQLSGVFPKGSSLHLGDAAKALEGNFSEAGSSESPVVINTQGLSDNISYTCIYNPASVQAWTQDASLAALFKMADDKRQELASRIKVNTPDPLLNTLGGALSTAADAVWEYPTFLHGAVAWRMRLNAWRGAYAADPLGWHDRARAHFDSYALSQVQEPVTGPVVFDSALNLARQLEKMGTSMFSAGYICRNPNGDIRPHHYDMNLVFVDQLLNHFNYTGDTAYVRKMWPLLELHLRWEKRNFDADNDGLYDAYACIWASDALQYSGGGVTHSSAYNYRANNTAAFLAGLIGKDPAPYRKEAAKILAAMQSKLWLRDKGSFAEYIDANAAMNTHASAGVWTIYHALDAFVPDAFQAYQAMQYVSIEIPHIPVRDAGLDNQDLYVLSTTNWQPYTWSVNNVALAENLHTALAYWQARRIEDAFLLWKSALVESMYLGTTPGNFQQLSFYDAVRGELYRDFADPVGMAARTLTEGLFGIMPDALRDTLRLSPGLPADWPYAELETPDVSFSYSKKKTTDQYIFTQKGDKLLALEVKLPMHYANVRSVTLNNVEVAYKLEAGIGKPVLKIAVPKQRRNEIKVTWAGAVLDSISYQPVVQQGSPFHLAPTASLKILSVKDPQQVLANTYIDAKGLHATVSRKEAHATIFVEVRQEAATWWQPIHLEQAESKETVAFSVVKKSTPVNLRAYYNEAVNNTFKNRYVSPRSENVSLQLPYQGIGNWCYPKADATIDDSGLRSLAAQKKNLALPDGTIFSLPATGNNIAYASQWDNFPNSVVVALSGKADHIALLMTGTTNHMQSQMENGQVIVTYTDGTKEVLSLRNPETWWPIEQDYMEDGYAFHLNSPAPQRIRLKDGTLYQPLDESNQYETIKGVSNRAVAGGAATVLRIKTNKRKLLKSLTVKATANEVLIGLMGLSLNQ